MGARKIAIGWVSVVLAALCTQSPPATADIIYNYKENWLFDSATGYYWQTQQVPSSTFAPSWGAVATVDVLQQLETDAGVSLPLVGVIGSTAPYSPTLANFISFFASDTPAKIQQQFSLANLFRWTADPAGEYGYLFADYEPESQGSTLYTYNGSATFGSYGPGVCIEAPYPCSPLQPAFAYSTLRPTPVPTSAWMLMCGLAALGLLIRNFPAATGPRPAGA